MTVKIEAKKMTETSYMNLAAKYEAKALAYRSEMRLSLNFAKTRQLFSEQLAALAMQKAMSA